MSDTTSFQHGLSKEEWEEFKYNLKRKGTDLNKFLKHQIKIERAIIEGDEKRGVKTTSAYEDELVDNLVTQDLSKVIINNRFDIKLNNEDFIKSAEYNIIRRTTTAVHKAVYRYWATKFAELRVPKNDTEYKEYLEKNGCREDLTREQAVQQEITKKHQRLEKLYERIEQIKVNIDFDLPITKLHTLKESDVGKVIKFNAVIIGPSEVKMELETGKYHQKVLVQELEEESKDNSPRIMKMIVHSDDTTKTQSGKHIVVIGQYIVQAPLKGGREQTELPLNIDVYHITDKAEEKEVMLSKKDLEIVRDMILDNADNYEQKMIQSFCPKIYGRELEKKALLLSLLGGNDVEGYRKESHLMLVGEADTGKSELVKFANKIAPKSSLIDGSNATGVGILYALDEYDGTKILRAGEMILNNNGMLCVDEYDKMPKSEQKKLNQAMEQQIATYNKGGHKARSETKVTIIASCNPAGERWTEDKHLIDNLPFDASTISRFDLMIRLRHDNAENQIRAKMEHIIKNKKGDKTPALDENWMSGLLNYLRKLKPKITEEAEELLINKFVEFSQLDQPTGSLPVQTRQMEGIQRLCEAYAKLLMRKNVTPDIVEKTITFYQECLCTLGMNVSKGISQMDLRGMSLNKDSFFEEVFRELALENDDGIVYINELADKLRENTNVFKSDKAIQHYINKRVDTGYIYEPKLGEYKRI